MRLLLPRTANGQVQQTDGHEVADDTCVDLVQDAWTSVHVWWKRFAFLEGIRRYNLAVEEPERQKWHWALDILLSIRPLVADGTNRTEKVRRTEWIVARTVPRHNAFAPISATLTRFK